MPNRSVYVFLHGVVVISPRGNDLRLILPDIPGHLQKAGSWLWETALARRSVLRLEGVRYGGRSIASTDPILYLPNLPVTSRKRAATIWVPKPDDILYLLCATDPHTRKPSDPAPGGAYVARTRDRQLLFPTVCGVAVLVYQYDDENQVMLKGHRWQPAPVDGAISLHIVSTSEEPEGKAHEDDTDDVLRQVLPGYAGLEHREPRLPAAPWMDPSHKSYGDLRGLRAQGDYFTTSSGDLAFAKAELEHPTSRALRLARLGSLRREGRPLQSLWYEPDFISDRPCNCGTFGTR